MTIFIFLEKFKRIQRIVEINLTLKYEPSLGKIAVRITIFGYN